MKQRTISSPIVFEGNSLFSDKYCEMILLPAPADTGVVFLVNCHAVPARVAHLGDNGGIHTTCLTLGQDRVQTTEHLMSALYGMHIDNVYIALSNGNVPGDTFSSQLYATAISRIGIREQSELVKPIIIQEEIALEEGESWAYLSPLQVSGLVIDAEIEFPEPIGRQRLVYTHDSPDRYLTELSWARSFVRSDINKQWPGGYTTWDAVREKIPWISEHSAASPVICFQDNHWVTPVMSEDEPIRHKVLDLIGDLSLIGSRVWGRLVIHWPGHAFNLSLVERIVETQRKARALET